jgi:arsenate reductase
MKTRVLFLCVHNSARSQLAEGLLRDMAGDVFEVYSAGSSPTGVNPFAIRVLQDRGIDASRQYSKNLNEFVAQPFDFVITLCDDEVCPVFPGALRRLHWGLPDPGAVEGDSEAKLDAFRRAAEAIEARLREFLQAVPQAAKM